MNKPLNLNIGDTVRQGDTLLRKVSSIPKGARELERDQHGRHVLAHGERTGHAHAFRNKGVCAFTKLDDADIEFLLVEEGGSGATLRHELVNGTKAEHNPITIPDGMYEAAGQYEHAPDPIRVAD